MVNEDRTAKVDKWLDDVSSASRRWKSAKAAQQSTERVIAYLEEVRSRFHGISPDMDARMDEAIEKNRENADRLSRCAVEQSELESGFYEVMSKIDPPEVAEAWRMRCIEGKTWAQCSMALHYNRQHLEKLSKRAKADVYGLLPEEYR